jgi:hypothetical protein
LLIMAAIVALLAASAWSLPNRPGHRMDGRAETPRYFADVAALSGVSAVSRNDAWAVGSYVLNHAVQLTLTEHWNGRSWRQVASPSPGGSRGSSELLGVSAISANDAWAVGIDGNTKNPGPNCLTEHWNGARWTAVPDATAGLLHCALTGVVAISPKDAWAVGTYLHVFAGHHFGANLTLIEHWDGTAWRRVAHPTPGGYAPNHATDMYEMAGTSPRDLWAVGDYDPQYPATFYHAVIEHWNGSTWATVRSPSPGFPDYNSSLVDVAAMSTSAWAVGDTSGVGPFILRLVHGRWQQVAIPSKHKLFKNLEAVAITSGRSAWAVGSYGFTGPFHPWILHWNGSSWAATRAPFRPGFTINTTLVAVTAPSSAATWAVGNVGQSNMASVTLIEHWTGTRWVIVPSPSP